MLFRSLLAEITALDPTKDVALELGGKNASIVLADADLVRAARMVAESACLTSGQRCNATSRVLVDTKVLSIFSKELAAAVAPFRPGWPAEEKTKLGPLVNAGSVERYRSALQAPAGVTFLEAGKVHEQVGGRKGHYVDPCVRLWPSSTAFVADPGSRVEFFAPVMDVVPVESAEAAIAAHNAVPFGLSASVFTTSRKSFEHFSNHLHAANIYANLPTTMSPSALPFGGWGDSGNRHPGGRGLIRFAADEQVLQEAPDSLS